MRFFSQFPKVNYKVGDSNNVTSLIDIYRHVNINETLLDDLTSYTYYEIVDGERPDVVSYKLYDTPEHHWTLFIVNEKLKDGLEGWPRSYNEQRSYIDKKYEQYSVLEFLPHQEVIDDDLDEGIPGSFTDKIKYHNFFNDIVFSDENVLLKKSAGEEACIISYDSNRLQIWVKELSNTSFLSDEETEYYLDSRLEGEAREEWLSTYILPFVKDYHPDIYDNLYEDERLDADNIAPYYRGTREDVTDVAYGNGFTIGSIDHYSGDSYGNDFKIGTVDAFANDSILSLLDSAYLMQIKFTTSRSWLKAYNAPYEYYDENEEYIATYDKLNVSPDSDDYFTYDQAEDKENDDKRFIRVLKKSEVEEFADYYKELINE